MTIEMDRRYGCVVCVYVCVCVCVCVLLIVFFSFVYLISSLAFLLSLFFFHFFFASFLPFHNTLSAHPKNAPSPPTHTHTCLPNLRTKKQKNNSTRTGFSPFFFVGFELFFFLTGVVFFVFFLPFLHNNNKHVWAHVFFVSFLFPSFFLGFV
eukprot:TRINITY_DN1476_c0_g1_i1.p2 TRINITY_DN1476_c0_g1~~TRINITY_DN1476_c0_g1_i1.p2  ORF type:complete len:152 (-),score=12.89 TRINITY_DN1476_c0_g1_i1:102-557(-)